MRFQSEISVFKFVQASVDGKHLVRFHSETSVFKYLRSVDGKHLIHLCFIIPSGGVMWTGPPKSERKKKLAYIDIQSEVKSNLFFFPRFVSARCIFFECWLVLCIGVLCGSVIKWIVWFWCCPQLKTAEIQNYEVKSENMRQLQVESGKPPSLKHPTTHTAIRFSWTMAYLQYLQWSAPTIQS